MKKITFNTLPDAISELIDRVEKIEKLLSKKTSAVESESVGKSTKKLKAQQTPSGLLSIKEAGKYLNMSEVNLYSYVKNKKIPFEKNGRRVFFSKTELDNWKKSRNVAGSASGDTITIKDAEKLLQLPAPSIYYVIKTRKLKPVAKLGNKQYFSKKELVNAFSKPEKKAGKAAKPAKTGKPAKAAKAAKGAVAVKTGKRGRPAKNADTTVAAKTGKRGRPAKNAVTTVEVKTGKRGRPAKAASETVTVKTGKRGRPAKATGKPRTPKAPVIAETPVISPVDVKPETEIQDPQNI